MCSSDLRVPIDPDWLLLKTVEALPPRAIFVEESLTAARHIPALLPYRDRFSFHGLASGGIGWGLPGAVGASLANPDRPVVCFTGDGSAMYTIQSLWTMAREQLDVTVVIFANRSYNILRGEFNAVGAGARSEEHTSELQSHLKSRMPSSA